MARTLCGRILRHGYKTRQDEPCVFYDGNVEELFCALVTVGDLFAIGVTSGHEKLRTMLGEHFLAKDIEDLNYDG